MIIIGSRTRARYQTTNTPPTSPIPCAVKVRESEQEKYVYLLTSPFPLHHSEAMAKPPYNLVFLSGSLADSQDDSLQDEANMENVVTKKADGSVSIDLKNIHSIQAQQEPVFSTLATTSSEPFTPCNAGKKHRLDRGKGIITQDEGAFTMDQGIINQQSPRDISWEKCHKVTVKRIKNNQIPVKPKSQILNVSLGPQHIIETSTKMPKYPGTVRVIDLQNLVPVDGVDDTIAEVVVTANGDTENSV